MISAFHLPRAAALLCVLAGCGTVVPPVRQHIHITRRASII